MAEQLQGFQGLDRFRKNSYWVALAAGIAVACYFARNEGAKQGYTMGFFTIIFGIAGIRLLTAPIGAMLWYRKWHCPACSKRLGMRVLQNCPHCNAQLFPDKS